MTFPSRGNSRDTSRDFKTKGCHERHDNCTQFSFIVGLHIWPHYVRHFFFCHPLSMSRNKNASPQIIVHCSAPQKKKKNGKNKRKLSKDMCVCVCGNFPQICILNHPEKSISLPKGKPKMPPHILTLHFHFSRFCVLRSLLVFGFWVSG